jgi:predicted esterase
MARLTSRTMEPRMIRTDESVKAEVNLYYDLYLPKGISTPAPLLITVHGYAAHKRYMMREAQLVAPEQFAIASLEGPNRFWRVAKEGDYRPVAGWLTDQRAGESVALHQRFILDVIAKHAEAGEIDPERVYLHGFSQACALNFRFAFAHPDTLKGFIGVCGGIPSDLDENPGYQPTKAGVLYLYSDNDEFYPLEKFEEFEGRLADYLPNFESKRYPAKHEITDEMRGDMREWLEERESDS